LRGRIARRILTTALAAVLLAGLPLGLLGKVSAPDEVRQFLPPEAPSLSAPEDAPAPARNAPPEPGKPWNFSADKAAAQHDARYVEAEGNVTLSQGANVLRADFARYYEATRWVFLKGHVRANWEGDILEAEEAEFDLASGVGWLKNGKIFVTKPHLYVQSEYLQKHKGDFYTFKNAKVTRCSGPEPAWSVTAREGEINMDGRTKLWHSAFNIKDVPVAYVPYGVIPGGRKRQSGLLMPEMSQSSRLGFNLNVPYYWAINDESDLTMYQNLMSNRGYMQGLEFRQTSDVQSKGLWRVDWFSDSRVDNTEAEEDPAFRGDGLTRKNRDRWWWRSKYNGNLGDPRWKTLMDLDVVSDQNYLREFKAGLQGYRRSRDEFIKQFGRDIDPMDSDTRTSTAQVSRSYDKFGIAGTVQYTQNLAYWNGNNKSSDDPTLQKLPELNFFAFKDRVGESPVEFEGGATYDYFWRQSGTTGHRLDTQPTASLPLSSRYGTVIPRAGVVHTMYDVDHWGEDAPYVNTAGVAENPRDSQGTFMSRTTYQTGFDAFTEFYRTFDLQRESLSPSLANAGETRWMAMKHSIVPRLEYDYRPTISGQRRYPYFDQNDRLLGRNISTVSLTNVLDRRRDTVSLVSDGTDARPGLATDYLDFLRLRLAQGYDYNEADRTDMTEEYPRRPFTDSTLELVIQPERYLSFTSRTRYSPYMGSVTEHEHMVRLQKDDTGRIFFGLNFLEPVHEYNRYRDRHYDILRLGGDVFITSNVILGADLRYDLLHGSSVDRMLSLTWQRECYDLIFTFEQSSGDNRFGVMVDLFRF
jgi:LPS-assembly protein